MEPTLSHSLVRALRAVATVGIRSHEEWGSGNLGRTTARMICNTIDSIHEKNEYIYIYYTYVYYICIYIYMYI